MIVIKGRTFDEVYKKSIMEILKNGNLVSPRGINTYELSPATLVIEEPRFLLTTPKERKGNYVFQLAELLWILRGSDLTSEIGHYNRQWFNFTDANPKYLNGAYGKRIRDWYGIDQFIEVYKKLKRDPYTRQAVIILFDPERDNIYEDGTISKDIPCTNYFNFQIRDGKLNMYTVMRSNDLHKGTIYDIPNFITIQHILAGMLDVEVGTYTHTAASFHIYESDIENLIDIYNTKEEVNNYNFDYNKITPKISLEEFNKILPIISSVEDATRKMTFDEFKINENSLLQILDSIENEWWRSVAASIIIYNYRKEGAHENLFGVYFNYVTNEYRNTVCNLKQIVKK